MSVAPRVAAIALAIALPTAHAASGADPATLTIDTADGPRHALVVAGGDAPRPTIVVLHGALGSGAATMRTTGFAEAAERHGFNAVYPDGIDHRWNDGREGGRGGTVDDVAFLRVLVDRLVTSGVARRDAVFVAGISNGGIMSFTMACRAPDVFAGVGTIIASRPVGVAPCAPRAIPLVMINGTADPLLPYRGGAVGFRGERGTVYAVDDTLSFFARVDRCEGPSVPEPVPHDGPPASTSAVRIEWTGCAPGTSVVAYRVDGGGHAIPRRPAATRAPFVGSLLGAENADFSAAEAIVAAFAGH